MRATLVSLLCGLVFFIVGVTALNWQLWRAAYTDRVQEAKLSVSLADSMVDEAIKAVSIVRPLTAGSCTPDAQRVLNREAAMGPHLRYVVLIRNHEVWCSSLLGSQTRKIQEDKSTATSLTLYPGDEITGGTPVLFYLAPGISGYVGASIGFVHLNTALKTASNRIQLTLVVGNKMLDYNDVVRPFSSVRQDKAHQQSLRYPFRIEYDPPPFFSLTRLISQGGFLTAILAIMSLVTGWILHRYLSKYTTPEENLRRAIEKGEIIPFYQPVVNGASGKIDGFEILARWKHPEAGFIPPDVFIPVAEKTGLIIELTHKLMMRVIDDLTPVLPHLPEGLHIGINISAAHGQSEELEYDCLHLLDVLSAKKITLVLEVTEREPLALTPKSLSMFARLRSHGVLVALDDFGTGYSGISYLNEFPVDFIKIDKSFVRRISNTPDSTLLVDCVIDMAKKMSLKIIAEGVETQHQADYLNAKGIHYLQGYFFWRPVPFYRLAPALLFGFHRISL